MAKQTNLKREAIAENECDEAKMSQMFVNEPKENKIEESQDSFVEHLFW